MGSSLQKFNSCDGASQADEEGCYHDRRRETKGNKVSRLIFNIVGHIWKALFPKPCENDRTKCLVYGEGWYCSNAARTASVFLVVLSQHCLKSQSWRAAWVQVQRSIGTRASEHFKAVDGRKESGGANLWKRLRKKRSAGQPVHGQVRIRLRVLGSLP